MTQRILFFCGPDMTGKTQIAKESSRCTGIPYFKASSEHNSYLSSQGLLKKGSFKDEHDLQVIRDGVRILQEECVSLRDGKVFKSKKSETFINQLRYADPRVFDVLKQTEYSLIFDRGFPCEAAYSEVMGRETDQVMLKHMDEMWSSIDARIVFCHRTDYAGIRDDLDPNIDAAVLQEIHEAYERFLSKTRCKVLWLNVDDENLDREVSEVVEFIKGDT